MARPASVEVLACPCLDGGSRRHTIELAVQAISSPGTRPWRAASIYFVLNACCLALGAANVIAAHTEAVDWLHVRHAANPRLYGTAGGWSSITYLLLGIAGILLVLLTSAAMWRDREFLGLASIGATFVLAVVLWWDTNVSVSICTGCDGGFPDPISTELNRAGVFFGLVLAICLGGATWWQSPTQRQGDY